MTEKSQKFDSFETARHIDKRIADLSSTINGLKDGTKFGVTPNLMQPARHACQYKSCNHTTSHFKMIAIDK